MPSGNDSCRLVLDAVGEIHHQTDWSPSSESWLGDVFPTNDSSPAGVGRVPGLASWSESAQII